jgi:hypothetical protein
VIARKSGLTVSSKLKNDRAATLKIPDPDGRSFECCVEVHQSDSSREEAGTVSVTLRNKLNAETCGESFKSDSVAISGEFTNQNVDSDYTNTSVAIRRYPQNIAFSSYENVFSPYLKPPG